MRKNVFKKLTSMLLISSMVVGSTAVMAGCGSKEDEVITLQVYSQLANYSGIQTGWIADELLKRFNVKLNIIPEQSGTYETRMENGDLGDIVVWGNDYDKYPDAVEAGLLLDWNDEDLLDDCGPYIKEHMAEALKKNQELTATITDGERDTLYGFGHNVAISAEDHESFFYTWDVRWDLYKELGYPEINTLDDFYQLMKDMVALCPEDDNGNKTYAVSLWPDWDKEMVMYVKSMATAYYGYDEHGVGLYDPQTGEYYDALMEDGPYLEMLKWFNKMYRDGLLDPDSMTQTYEKMAEKVQNGGTMFSIFNYSGSLAYNKPYHLEAGKFMYCMRPNDASPIVYGMNPQGGDRIWSIGAKSEYPELCMEIINWLCTPEGCMISNYGPKGLTWDYDEEGNPYLTELGMQCQADKQTELGNGIKGNYNDGSLQIVNTTWSIDAENPDSNGETYNYVNWKSTALASASEIEQDWREHTNSIGINDYMEKGKYTVAPGTSYTKGRKEQELNTTWAQVTAEIRNSSWKAIYAESDAEYNKIVNSMIKKANEYGYDKCVAWSVAEAERRKALEDAATGGKNMSKTEMTTDVSSDGGEEATAAE